MRPLKEVQECRQVRGEPCRRWFDSDQMDLIVWCNDAGAPIGFQLCYDVGRKEHALTWRPGFGYTHNAVDDGDDVQGGIQKRTPVLVPNGAVNFDRLRALFTNVKATLPTEIASFVSEHLEAPSPRKTAAV